MKHENHGPINPLEIDLEDAIEAAYRENPDRVRASGLEVYGEMRRQVRIPEVGVLDLATVDYVSHRMAQIWGSKRRVRMSTIRVLIVDIIELKRTPLQTADFIQLARYMAGVQAMIPTRIHGGYLDEVRVRGHLVGKGLSNDARDGLWMKELIEEMQVYEWVLDLRYGIRFDLVDDISIPRQMDALASPLTQVTCDEARTIHRRAYESLLRFENGTPQDTRPW